MSRMGVGKTYADKDQPLRWYVALVLDGIWVFVWWEDGRFHSVLPNRVRVEAYDFSIFQLCTRWGVRVQEIDRFLERKLYAPHPDVKHVRETGTYMMGRTLVHVKEKHDLGTKSGMGRVLGRR